MGGGYGNYYLDDRGVFGEAEGGEGVLEVGHLGPNRTKQIGAGLLRKQIRADQGGEGGC